MTQYLPPNLLAHFAPRPPIPFLPPPDKLPHQKKTTGYTGVADFLLNFEDPKDTPPPVRIETREERQERKRREKKEQMTYKLEVDLINWKPKLNPAATADPYKTLFVARLNYDTSESKLRREFEQYGEIKKIVMVHDEISGKPRGYAFIEYERERDMHTAYKRADGRKIDGRRVVVDFERGRTIEKFRPRRLGGGLGGTRRGGPEVNIKHSGRVEEPGDEERYGERERELRERTERRRSRSRSRERRRRSRSRERHRGDRGDRYKRERSKERDRGRDREPMLGGDKLEPPNEIKREMPPDMERKERRRSRSRDRDRERRRRRSRSRERGKYHDRDRDARRRDRGEREERMKEEVVENAPVDPMNPQNGFDDTGY